MTLTDQELFEKAEAVRQAAYAPYSEYKVGVAIVDDKGRLHVGCNVENAAYPLGVCAEISAISAMVAQGGAVIKKMAVVGGGDALEFCAPCGGCRQAISEFAGDDTEIMLKNQQGTVRRYTVPELLPLAFRLST